MDEEKREQIQLEVLSAMKETTVSKIAAKYEVSETQVLGIIHQLNEDGYYIAAQPKKGEIYILNKVSDLVSTKTFKFSTDEQGMFRFGCISGTYIGSKYEQPTLLENFYDRMAAQGVKRVFLIGNMTAGLYSIKNKYFDTLYLKESEQQINHIVDHYPKRDGITTYFLTGLSDEPHLKTVNIGQEISQKRPDMIYLGHLNCGIEIDNVNVHLLSSNLKQTYALSYRAQQQIVSYRKETQPELLIMGSTHQMQFFPYGKTFAITLPSLVAPTPEMTMLRRDLVVGDVSVLIKTKDGKLVGSPIPMTYQHERTIPNDYQKVYRKGAMV